MAAYWFEILLIAPDSNDQNVGYRASVSTKSYWPGCAAVWSSRGGIRGQKTNPISARSVVRASVLRQRG